jgi:predicted ATPase
LEALVRQLAGLAALQPVLMVLEDAHWIDPTTLELIENCLDVISDKAVMVLLTSRPDNQPQLAAHPHVTRLTLNRLGRVGLKEIIARLGGKALPEDTIDAIIARTDGVPLFVEELTKAILETGQTTIPVSLHDSLMSRLDRFPDVKEVAQIAACIGREFDFSLLGRITERTEAELTSALERLISAELVFRRGSTTTGGFIFKHALVRDAAYESLLKGKRQDVHSKLVHVLEDQKSATPEVIARHAEAAGMIEKAIEQWAVSGAQAINRPAYKEAIASYNSAVSLCQSLGEDPRWQRRELELQVALGQALIANRGYQAPATLQTFERALALAEAIGEAELLVPPLYGLWASRYLAGQPSADLAERMADIVSARDDTGAKCVSARMLALETYYKAQYHRSLELVDEALSIYDVDNHRGLALRYAHDPRAAATFYKAWNLWHLGYPERAKATAEEALEWARHIDHPNTLGISLCYGIALTNIWIGDHERVRQAAEEALLLAQEKSLGLWEAWGRIYLGWAIFQDDRQEGLGELMAGITASRRIGAVRHEAFHLGLAADMHSRAGLHDQIDEMFEKAFAVLDQTRDLPFAVDLHRLRATACLRRSSNEADVAQQHLLTALDIARTQQALSLELRAATDLAKLWANAGERSKALELLSGVRVRITEGATLPDLVNADTLLSNWS